MRYTIPVLIGLVVFATPDAEARRRRRPRGQLYGQLAPKTIERPGARLSRAFWMFGVAGLQQKRLRGTWSDYVVYLDVWDEAAFDKQPTPEIKIEGAAITPRVLVIPRRAATESVVIRNLDRMKHNLTSPDHPDLKNLVLPHNAREVVKLENILPLQVGKQVTYSLRSRDFKRMRGEIVFLRSSAYTHVGPGGRFQLRYLPAGEHTLYVLYRGKVRLQKKVTIGRRALNVKTLTLVETK